MREKRFKLRDKISNARESESVLYSEISTLKKQKATIGNARFAAQRLQRYCDWLGGITEEISSFVVARMMEYQAIKESTDDLIDWANGLRFQTETMRSWRSSNAQLCRTARKIVDSLLEKDDPRVQAICRQLERLYTTSTNARIFLIE